MNELVHLWNDDDPTGVFAAPAPSDFEGLGDTVVDDSLELPAAPRLQSYIGALPREADDLRTRRHAQLEEQVLALETAVDTLSSWDPSVRAAAATLRRRVAELRELTSALERVAEHGKDAVLADVFAEESPLAAFLAGAYLWADGVACAMATLARQLGAMIADWAAFRERLSDVHWLLELTNRERRRVEPSWLPEELAGDLSRAFAALDRVALGLEERFG
jgi:hypothetical protein